MGSRFVISLLTAFVLTLSVLGGIGWATARLIVATPHDRFLTSYFEFDLAPGWSCELDGTEYVCRPAGKPPFPAIAIIAMKERNNQDRLEDYEAHLRARQPITMKSGETKMSEVRSVERKMLGGKQWVEGLHAGSEIPNYLTYYLARPPPPWAFLSPCRFTGTAPTNTRIELDDMMSSLKVYQR